MVTGACVTGEGGGDGGEGGEGAGEGTGEGGDGGGEGGDGGEGGGTVSGTLHSTLLTLTFLMPCHVPLKLPPIKVLAYDDMSAMWGDVLSTTAPFHTEATDVPAVRNRGDR